MHYELRAWARSDDRAYEDLDGVVEVGRYPGDDKGLEEAVAAYRALVGDSADLLSACLESGIAARDMSAMGACLFGVGAPVAERTAGFRLEASFGVSIGEDGKAREPVAKGRWLP